MKRIAVGEHSLFFDPSTYNLWRVEAPEAEPPVDHPQREELVTAEVHVPTELNKLTLLISELCNFSCLYCCGNAYAKGQPMSRDILELALDRFMAIYRGQVRAIMFFGGEPMLNQPVLWHAMDRARALATRHDQPPPSFSMVSNGSLFTPAVVRRLADYRVRVTVSLDGPARVHDRQRLTRDGRPTHALVTEGIARLRAAGVITNVEVTYSLRHREAGVTVLDTIQHAHEYGAGEVHLMPVCGDFPGLTPTDEELAGMVAEFRAAARYSIESLAGDSPVILASAFRVVEVLSLRVQMPQLCFAGANSATVHADGNVYPCYLLRDPSQWMGNIADAEFVDAFPIRSAGYRNKPKQDFAQCAECWANKICFSCYGVEFPRHKRLMPPRPAFCSVQKGIMEGALEGVAALRSDPMAWKRALDNIVK
ncbi:MAG: radical SAM protein [Magnetococcales bacterium]|nr:radical SAM protein [Magnetococcales bacterium]